MVLVRYEQSPPNKTLQGQKLLYLLDGMWKLSDEEIAAVKHKYPDLKIQFGAKPSDISKEEWKDVTILVSGAGPDGLPDKEDAPNLQYVQLASAGANSIVDHPLYTDTDVAFCTANGVHGPQITEWIIATFLSFQHQLPDYMHKQREGKWIRGTAPVQDAVKQRVGILGYGSIGRQLARVSVALGMDVHAYTLHEKKTPESKQDNGYVLPGLGDPDGSFPSKWFYGSSKDELHAFLGSGLDLLVVALPLTPATTGLISAPEFEVLSKKKTFLSNIGRGPIVNTDDLITALDQELIRGAALDVTDPEPLPHGHPLWSAKNCLVTPHISAASTSYFDRVWGITKLNLQRLSEGGKLVNKVNRREGY